ncbi:MAG: hypothetical protein A2145_01070 [candidate division Zixibacteria bacterium RBG_16_40_9]|nr:MAG: hypothetical protein A2145_01070 [candidate division Zixibacteria bacterium RBG_16_40_9]
MFKSFNFKSLFGWGFIFLIFTLMGVIIASNLDFSPASKAQNAINVQSESGVSYDNGSPFVAVAEKVSPAVVNISAKRVEERDYHDGYAPFFDEEFFKRFFGYTPRKMPRKFESKSLGSGFIFKEDGYVLTCNHVISRGKDGKVAEKITVKLADGSEYRAEVIGRDKETDVAVLKINAKKDLPAVELGDSDDLKVGEWSAAIGNPFPQYGLDRTVTVGVISAKGRKGLYFGEGETPAFQNYIQTDASINPGNSGGPLVNIRGEVIGVNAAITSPSGGNIGIGFAIPINTVKQILPDLMGKGKVARGYLGISPRDIDSDLAESLNLTSTTGVLVETVQPETPADKAGLKVGDVILKFNAKKVTGAEQFRNLVAETSPGSKVNLEVLREGKTLSLQTQLKERPITVAQAEEGESIEEESWLGITVATVTKDLAEYYGVKYRTGAIVTDVEPGSPADEKGIQIGDIIMQVDGKKVTNGEEYKKIVITLKKREKAISFVVSRGEPGNTVFLAIKPE